MDQLKKVRETSFLDLDEISDHLSIPKLYLQAIEEGVFSHLPQKKHLAEKYITSYADFLEVDAKPIMDAYLDSQRPKQNFTPRRAEKRSTRSSSKKKSFWFTYQYYILACGAGLCLTLVIWLFIPSNKSESTSSVHPPVQNSTPAITENKDRPIFTLQKTSSDSSVEQTWFISQTETLHIQIQPLGDMSLLIREDSTKGKIIADKELSKSESFDLSGKKWLFVHLDDPSQALIKVNGVVIDTTSQKAETTYEFKIASN